MKGLIGIKKKIEKYLKLGLAITSGVATLAAVCSACKATIKATEVIREKETEKGEPLTTKEKIVATWKLYIPAGILTACSVGGTIASQILNSKAQASIAGACTLASQKLTKYQNAVKEKYGEEANNDIQESIASSVDVERADLDVCVINPGTFMTTSLDFDTVTEKRIFKDDVTNSLFESTFEKVLIAENTLNRMFQLSCGEVTYNDFLKYLGRKPMEYGDEIGWSFENYEEVAWIDFNHRKEKLEDGRDYWVIEYVFPPLPFVE